MGDMAGHATQSPGTSVCREGKQVPWPGLGSEMHAAPDTHGTKLRMSLRQ